MDCKPRILWAKLENEPTWRGLLSLRDPTGAAHAVGPPGTFFAFYHLTDAPIVVIFAPRDEAVSFHGKFLSHVTACTPAPASARFSGSPDEVERLRLFDRRPRASPVNTHLAERA